MILGADMHVVGAPPAKFAKALATISASLHPAFDKVVPPGKSKESCVLASLAVRDFLWRAGFKDARAQTVYLVVQALDENDREIHSLGVGDHAKVPSVGRAPNERPDRWNGHMVVVVPSVGYLVDTTLFPAKRSAWPKLPGMLAASIEPGKPGPPWQGLVPITGTRMRQADGSMLYLIWMDQANERWRGAPDTERDRRDPVVKTLVRRFGSFR